MTRLRLLTLHALTFALLLAPSSHAEDETPNKTFSFSLKRGLPPTQVTLLWKDSMLQGMEFRAKAGGAVSQRIKIGEGQTVGCDLDQENLPPKWIGALDYNGDGFQDLYLLVARGAEPTHAILLYDATTKRFVANKALASVQGLDLNTAAAEAVAADRKLDECFGLVTKETMKTATITITGRALKKGDAITVLRFGEDQTVLTAEIGEKLKPTEGSGPTYTLVCEPEPAAEDAFVGIAVMGAIGGITLDGAKVPSTRVAGGPAGNRLYLRSCTSGEGMHLTVWAGRPLVGARVWHRYHHLGYDVEPNCTLKDYRE